MKQRDEYIVDCTVHNQKPVNLICDTTFYGKRKEKLIAHGYTIQSTTLDGKRGLYKAFKAVFLF